MNNNFTATNFMDQNPFWESNRSSGSQEIPSLYKTQRFITIFFYVHGTMQSRTHKTLHRYSMWQTKDRIKNNWIRHLLHTQFPELLMMSEWRSKHVEYYHQIKSIKSCISLVIYMFITMFTRSHHLLPTWAKL